MAGPYQDDLDTIRPVLRALLGCWECAPAPLYAEVALVLPALRRLAAEPAEVVERHPGAGGQGLDIELSYRHLEPPAAEHDMAEVRHVLHEAVNSVCRCGGAGPGEGCAACDLWHALPRWMREDEFHG